MADTIDTLRDIGLKNGHDLQNLTPVSSTKRKTILASLVLRSTDETTAAGPLLEDAFSSMDFGMALLDGDLNFVACNAQFMRDFASHRTAPISIGTPIDAVLSEAFQAAIYELPVEMSEVKFVDHFRQLGRNDHGPMKLRHKNGRVILASAKNTNLGGLVITTRKVTEDHNTDAKTREALFDALEELEEGFALWDNDMRFLMSNQRFVDIVMPFRKAPFAVGTTVEDAVREIFRNHTLGLPENPSEDEQVSAIQDWVRSFGAPREFQRKDGRIVRLNVKPTKLDGFLVTAVDLTEERNSEAKARDMLLGAFEALDEGLVLCDEEMNFVFANAAWYKMMFEGVQDKAPKRGDSIAENLIMLVKEGFYAIPEGQTEDDFIQWLMGEMSQHGKRVPCELANGRHIVGSSHVTAFGGSLLFVRDVTTQQALEAELSQQREIAHQNEKLSALGELLAGVAHELNNPLSVVFGYSQMLQGKINDPVMSERVDWICQSSERAAKIVRTFLAMARQRPTKMEPCSVNEILETALEVSSYSLKTNGTDVRVNLDAGDPMVTGDFDQLAQVFSNLIVNAGHAVGDQGTKGRITVRSKRNGGLVEVEIADNGNGIPQDIQSRIFEPFFTTKDVGEGTGIGLAFSHRIVESHDGNLTVKSKMGHGTQFIVRLLDAADSPAVTAELYPHTNTGQSVLVVDDENAVAHLISDLLTEAGFTVTVSTDPRAALRLAEAQHFDAVLSDFKMPQMNGEIFFKALKAVAPDNARRTGFVTGDALSAQVLAFFDTSKRPHIEKPIMKNELLGLIARLTGKTAA